MNSSTINTFSSLKLDLAKYTMMADDDNMSVSSLGDDCIVDEIATVREELAQKSREREAEELGMRLRVALQVPCMDIDDDDNQGERGSTGQRKKTPAAYEKIKETYDELSKLDSSLSFCAKAIYDQQNSMGRSTDVICVKLQATLEQGLSNLKECRRRIEILLDVRQKNRALFLRRMAEHRSEYEDNIAKAYKVSEEEWKPIAAQVASLQDEKKGTEGLAQMMELVIGI